MGSVDARPSKEKAKAKQATERLSPTDVARSLEDRLRESEQKYRTLVESAGEAIAVVTREGVFLFMNRVAALRLGGVPENYIGQTMWDLFPPPIADNQMETVHSVLRLQEGKSVVSRTEVGGQLRWYDTTVVPLQETAGRPADKVLIIGRDIDKLKKAEQEVARYREDMIRAEHQASLGTLSATVAHELNQPLTVIKLSLENTLVALEQDKTSPERCCEMLRDALVEVKNTETIMNRFRSFARRSIDHVTTAVDISALVKRVLAMLDSGAQLKGVRLLEEIPAEAIEIQCDANALTQILFSLVQNSIQAADGQLSNTVRVQLVPEAERVELNVADDCGGIDPDHLSQIFEPFFTTKPTGTGLGLCLVKRLVRDMGGQVHVNNEPRRGVTFRISLPRTSTS